MPPNDDHDAPEMIRDIEDQERGERFLVGARFARDADGLRIQWEAADRVQEMLEHLAEGETYNVSGWGECWDIQQPTNVEVNGDRVYVNPRNCDPNRFCQNGRLNYSWLTMCGDEEHEVVFNHPVDDETVREADDVLDQIIKRMARKHLIRTELEVTVRQTI